MYCKKCGSKLDDSASECPVCGARLDEKHPWKKKNKENSSNEFMLSLIAVFMTLIVVAAGIITYVNRNIDRQKTELVTQIENSQIKEYIQEKNEILKADSGNFLNVAGKKDTIKKLENVKEKIDQYNSSVKENKTSDAGKPNASYDPSDTDETVANSYNEKTDDAAYIRAEPEKYLNIDVQQVDASAFPKVKLYLNVQDTETGNVPGNLDGKFFYINKEDATAQYVKQVISAGYQLNGTEALKVNMVADVSGSMDGEPLWEAKTVMSNFINSVQFSAGDMVELISFATGVSLEQQFTNDATLLNNYISGLTTGDMTSLYDALYTAVGRVAAQNGARCVIAFTDGNDNYSNCSSSDVIDLAARYHIPVFIIGVGDADYSGVADIAYSTGGMYYNVHEIISMEDIYNQIYKMEKELYLIEYEDTSATALTDQINVQVGYKDQTYSGECYYSYVPNTLLSVDAQTFYTDGPEAVVERYMKAFDDAMTYADFSYIEDCLLPGSSIYGEQQSYVQKGIKEQLDSYEIVRTDYSDSNNCVITTRETYLVQKPGESLKLMTQQCQYQVTNTGGGWKMTAFASPVQVLSKINQ